MSDQNFSQNQMTGVVCESQVATLFLSWGWVVGRDQVDVGYDLFVEPSSKSFEGLRFHVQVKGTVQKKKGRVCANVAKQRLRKYAGCPLPVVLVRVLANGDMYWVHAQQWCKENSHRLSGDGRAGVVFPAENVISDHDSFVGVLGKIFSESVGVTSRVIAGVREKYLSSLDSRIQVSVSTDGGRTKYELRATEEVTGTLAVKFPPEQADAGRRRFAEMLEYGTPIDVVAEEVAVTGSPVFDEIGAARLKRGEISIRQAAPRKARISWQAGAQFSFVQPSFSCDALIFRGSKGISVLPEEALDFPLFLKVQATSDGLVEGRVHFQLSFGIAESVKGRDIASVQEFSVLHDFAEAALRSGSIFMTIEADGVRIPAVLPVEGDFKYFIYCVLVISRLHKICRFLGVSSVISNGDNWFTDDEVRDIAAAMRLLRGERLKATLESVGFSETKEISISANSEAVISTGLVISAFGEKVGEVPVFIDAGRVELVRGDDLNYTMKPLDQGAVFVRAREGGATP